MTLGCFGRTVESAQQGTGIGVPKGFVPTSNERVLKTLKDLQVFNQRLNRLEVSFNKTKAATDNHLAVVREVMEAPLPEAFGVERKGADLVATVEKVGGAEFKGDDIMKAGLDYGQAAQSTVLAPIRSWRERLTTLEGRSKQLEAERLELDMWRRKAGTLSATVEKERAQLTPSLSIRKQTKLQGKLENNIKALQEREGRVAVLTQAFGEHEAALYADLSTLANDASWAKVYVQKGLQAEAAVLAASATAFGSLPDPPPVAAPAAAAPAAAVAAAPAVEAAAP